MTKVYHDGGNGLKRMHHKPVHLVEELLCGGATAGRLKKEAEILHVQFAPMNVIVLLAVLLDGDVGEVNIPIEHNRMSFVV